MVGAVDGLVDGFALGLRDFDGDADGRDVDGDDVGRDVDGDADGDDDGGDDEGDDGVDDGDADGGDDDDADGVDDGDDVGDADGVDDGDDDGRDDDGDADGRDDDGVADGDADTGDLVVGIVVGVADGFSVSVGLRLEGLRVLGPAVGVASGTLVGLGDGELLGVLMFAMSSMYFLNFRKFSVPRPVAGSQPFAALKPSLQHVRTAVQLFFPTVTSLVNSAALA